MPSLPLVATAVDPVADLADRDLDGPGAHLHGRGDERVVVVGRNSDPGDAVAAPRRHRGRPGRRPGGRFAPGRAAPAAGNRGGQDGSKHTSQPVSYTHLTLPTIYSV